jgi:hypothetical protein
MDITDKVEPFGVDYQDYVSFKHLTLAKTRSAQRKTIEAIDALINLNDGLAIFATLAPWREFSCQAWPVSFGERCGLVILHQ